MAVMLHPILIPFFPSVYHKTISLTVTSGHYGLSPVLDTNDDSSGFDPVVFLNGLFPTEQLLRYSETHRASVHNVDSGGDMEVLFVDIRRAMDRLDVISQAAAAPGGPEGIHGALSPLEELRRGIRRVAHSARGTTASICPMVVNIWRQDNTKRNL